MDVQGQLTFPNIISLSPSMAGSRERADEQGEESQTSAGRVRAGQSPKNWYENPNKVCLDEELPQQQRI